MPDENLALQFRYEDGTYSDFPTDAGASAAKLRAVINEVDMTGSVSDVVVDQYKKPVEGTTVELVDGNGEVVESTTVGADGKVDWAGVQPGDYTLRVTTPDGYSDVADQSFTVKPGETGKKLPDLGIEALDGSVSDVVVDQYKKPVEGTTVELVDGNGEVVESTTVGADGKVDWAGVQPGDYTLRVTTPDGYSDVADQSFTVKPGETGKKLPDLGIEALDGSVSDVVVDQYKKPVEGTTVELVDGNGEVVESTTVGADGKVDWAGVQPGDYTLRVTTPDGYSDVADQSFTVKPGETGKKLPDLGIEALDGSVSDVVVDQYKKPVEGTTVELVDGNGEVVESTTVGADGKVDWAGVQPGDYTLRVTTPDGYSDVADQSFTVKPGETGKKLPDLGIEALDGSVSDVVVDQYKKPVEGTTVELVDGNGEVVESTTVGADGKVDWAGVQPGDYTLRVTTPDGYSDVADQSFTVKPGETGKKLPDLGIEALDGSVSDVVVDQYKKPVEGTTVELVDGNGEVVESTTVGADGKVDWAGVQPGDYTLRVTTPDGYSDVADQSFTVKPGETGKKLPPLDIQKDAPPVSATPTSTAAQPSKPTTSAPSSTAKPTTTKPTTSAPSSTAKPTTTKPTTSAPSSTAKPTTTKPTTSAPSSTAKPTTTKPTTSAPSSTAKPTTTKPTTSAPSSTAKPTTTKPTTSAPSSTAKPTTTKPTTTKPTTSAPKPTAAPAPSTDSKPEEKNPSIVGTITDPEGNPLPPTKDKDGKPQLPTVIVKDKDGNQVVDPIQVDENGNFEVPALPEDGDYVVIVDAPDGFNDPKPQVVPVQKGETSKLPPITVDKPEIDLDKNKPAAKPGSVHGWLVDESNRPITGSDIKLVKKGVTDPETGETFDYEVPIEVDADGYFVTPPIDFKYFPEGKADFDLEVTLPEGWPDADINGDKINRTVTVEAGESTPVEIKVEAPKTQSIVGRVDDGNGKAVPGTTVVVTDPRGNSRVIPVEDDGTFEVDDVIPGVHDVEILTPGRGNDADPIKVPVRTGEKVELPEIHLTTNKSLKLEKRVWGRDADNNGKVKNEDGELVDDVMTVKDGEDLIYALIVTNDGDEPIKDIEFDDPELEKRNIELTMPEGWTAESELAPGESKVWSAKMKAPEDAFDFNNVATANGVTSKGEKVGSLPDSAYTKFLRGAVDKKVNARFATNKDKPVQAAANSPLGFTYEVKNTGSTAMVNVKLTDIVYEDGIDENECKPVKASEKTEDSQCYDLDVKAPEGFTGTLLPGERVVFTAELPEGLKPGAKHHNAAEARGELPARPGRGGSYEGEPDYGDDPSSVLIISPKDNIKGNAHVVVSEGAELDSSDLRVVAWVDENANGKQDPDESLSGLKLTLVPSDGTPSFAGNADENGNVLFEGTPYGKYTVKIDSPGELRLVDPKDPENNSFDPGAVLESKEFEVNKDEQYINLQLETPRTAGISEGNAGQPQGEEEDSSLGKCLASASSVSNPVAWLVPLGLLGAVMGGIGVMFEDELNQISAQANAAIREAMPNVDLGIGFQQPEWVTEIQGQWQAQIDQVNRQLAQINPAAPAAAGGVALLAIAGLLTGIFYAGCEAGWFEPSEEGSSAGSSSKADAEGTEDVAGSSSSSSEGGSSKKDEADSETQPEEAAN
ncbi:carboxypeptidase regulatory-like domain-containing protein [Corynebacterium afermentans]|uniref:carboxypeptidase regulatory-like domain-containing protein n=1 Tax=Corynebacterium afermentans TaxID=38286 RepID=UPI0025B5E0A3|nr:carboxypeptidase regulatory-like domain-containing protein [Corynebacterium afermentans]